MHGGPQNLDLRSEVSSRELETSVISEEPQIAPSDKPKSKHSTGQWSSFFTGIGSLFGHKTQIAPSPAHPKSQKSGIDEHSHEKNIEALGSRLDEVMDQLTAIAAGISTIKEEPDNEENLHYWFDECYRRLDTFLDQLEEVNRHQSNFDLQHFIKERIDAYIKGKELSLRNQLLKQLLQLDLSKANSEYQNWKASQQAAAKPSSNDKTQQETITPSYSKSVKYFNILQELQDNALTDIRALGKSIGCLLDQLTASSTTNEASNLEAFPFYSTLDAISKELEVTRNLYPEFDFDQFIFRTVENYFKEKSLSEYEEKLVKLVKLNPEEAVKVNATAAQEKQAFAHYFLKTLKNTVFSGQIDLNQDISLLDGEQIRQLDDKLENLALQIEDFKEGILDSSLIEIGNQMADFAKRVKKQKIIIDSIETIKTALEKTTIDHITGFKALRREGASLRIRLQQAFNSTQELTTDWPAYQNGLIKVALSKLSQATREAILSKLPVEELKNLFTAKLLPQLKKNVSLEQILAELDQNLIGETYRRQIFATQDTSNQKHGSFSTSNRDVVGLPVRDQFIITANYFGKARDELDLAKLLEYINIICEIWPNLKNPDETLIERTTHIVEYLRLIIDLVGKDLLYKHLAIITKAFDILTPGEENPTIAIIASTKASFLKQADEFLTSDSLDFEKLDALFKASAKLPTDLPEIQTRKDAIIHEIFRRYSLRLSSLESEQLATFDKVFDEFSRTSTSPSAKQSAQVFLGYIKAHPKYLTHDTKR